jgi:hypothetical protein
MEKLLGERKNYSTKSIPWSGRKSSSVMSSKMSYYFMARLSQMEFKYPAASSLPCIRCQVRSCQNHLR